MADNDLLTDLRLYFLTMSRNPASFYLVSSFSKYNDKHRTIDYVLEKHIWDSNPGSMLIFNVEDKRYKHA